jgi:hypothetical protein
MNEELVKELVENTGCDQNLAIMLLQFTGGDIEGVKRILDAVPKDIFALKMKFITQITGYYGAAFFCFDEKEKKIKRFISVVTDDREIGKIDVSIRWRDFEDELYEYSRTKKVDGLKIEQFKQRFLEKAFVSKISNVLKTGRPVSNDVLNSLLVDTLYNIFADTNIAVKFHIEMTDAFELNKGITIPPSIGPGAGQTAVSEGTEKEQKEEKVGVKDQSLVVLKIDPVLSPVSGIGIKELEFGDEIQVRITDERDIGDYLAELLGGKVDSIRVPLFTKIIEVKDLGDGNVGVFTQFGPGIVGMFKVPEDVRVVTRREPEEQLPPERKSFRDLHPMIVIGGVVLVIVILIMMVFLSR